MLVEFLRPSKFPNLRAATNNTVPILTLSTVKPSFAISMKLLSILNAILPNFTQIQVAKTEDINPEDKTSSFKYFLVPCQAEGWEIKKNEKASSAYFNSKGLNEFLLKEWKLPENVNLIRIPVSETVQTLNEIKGIELKVEEKTFTEKAQKD
ncbi:hypothetical protein [Emticicia sp.]|uniref:hypothetical protein n=1 Tax=Emticicia sp. TaxID=1930953 RepID=UPI0037526A9C